MGRDPGVPPGAHSLGLQGAEKVPDRQPRHKVADIPLYDEHRHLILAKKVQEGRRKKSVLIFPRSDKYFTTLDLSTESSFLIHMLNPFIKHFGTPLGKQGCRSFRPSGKSIFPLYYYIPYRIVVKIMNNSISSVSNYS